MDLDGKTPADLYRDTENAAADELAARIFGTQHQTDAGGNQAKDRHFAPNQDKNSNTERRRSRSIISEVYCNSKVYIHSSLDWA